MALAAKSLSDITECSICLQMWRDPRSLPRCDHTFCLECLKTYVKRKDEESEQLVCPVCRKEFPVPQRGLDALPKNFMHQQLLDARIAALTEQTYSAATEESSLELTEEQALLCELGLCSGNVTATRYCVDCDQNMCETCSMAHSRSRAMKNHTVIDLSEKQNPHFIRKLRSSYCEKHEEERIKLYCEQLNCKTLLCTICHATEHVGHKCTAIQTAAQGFVDKITGRYVNIEERITKRKSCLDELKKHIEEFLENISEKEQLLTATKDHMILLIEAEHTKLWHELKYIKERRLNKDLKIRVEEAESELLVLQAFQATLKELMEKGSACDICRSANDIITEADSLINSEKDSTLQAPEPIEVNFTSATIPNVNGFEIHLVGVISCKWYRVLYTSQWPINQSNMHQITLDQMYDKMTTDTSELLIKINQLGSDLKLKTSEIDQIKKEKELMEIQLNDTKVLKDLHAQAEADLHKQLQQLLQQNAYEKNRNLLAETANQKQLKQLQQQNTEQRNKHSQEEELHSKEMHKLQAKIKETEEDFNNQNKYQQQLKGKLDDMNKLKDQHVKNEQELKEKLEQMIKLKDHHAKNELELKGKLDETTRLKDQHAKNELELKGKLDEMTKLNDQQAKNELDLKKQLEMMKLKNEELRDELKRSKDEIQRDKTMKTLDKPVKIGAEQETTFKILTETKQFSSTTFLQQSSIVHVIESMGYVDGLAVIGSQVFIARLGISHIEVYDANNLTILPRNLEIGSTKLYNTRLAACSHYNCLYVKPWSNDKETVFYRVELTNSSITNWTVNGNCKEFSKTNKHSLLVTLYSGRVQEYTTFGKLIREIFLDIVHPQHCIQLSDGNFVVCHGNIGLIATIRKHRVCIVDANGRILKSYGGTPGSGVDQLNSPCHLSVDSSDHVFVADNRNHRIVLLSPTMTFLGTVQTPRQQLKSPRVLHLDENSRRLYIVDDNGHVIIIEVTANDKK